MKKIVFYCELIVVVVLFFSCDSDQNADNSRDSAIPMIGISLRNQQAAMLSIQAYSSHNVNEILKYWDSSGVDYGDGSGRAVKGMDSLKYLFTFLFRVLRNIRVDSIKTLSDNGEHVIVTGIWSGSVRNDSLGIPETKFNYWNGDFFTFNEAGKIVEHKSIQSHLGILAQMGLLDKLKEPRISK
jgi:hypothetical protein